MENRFYYQLLPLLERRMYCELVKGIKAHETKIRVLGSVSQSKKVIKYVYCDYPEFFYVDISQNSFQRNRMVTIVEVYYHKNLAESKVIGQYLEKIAMRFLEQAEKEKMNDLTLVKYAHDFIIRNVEYAYENLEWQHAGGDVSCISGVFWQHRAVCRGIAAAVKWLLDRAGIMSAVIEGRMVDENAPRLTQYTGTEDEINHAWNLVCVNDGQYFMDVTMDLGVSLDKDWLSYDYFLRNDELMDSYTQYHKRHVVSGDEQLCYFAIFQVIFSDLDMLKKYLDYCRRKKKKRIYFQLRGEYGQDVEKQVMTIVGHYIMDAYRYRVNKKINIFDIMIG